ncbi:MAG: tRNA (adenosine(37)-N6)-threonylcarbamoyltransferase complex transferase subunit TsaD [Bryobacteraceae bacterium]
MRILGIESSCDETAAAIVEDGRRVLASVVASQLDLHARYGGVVPELASREHLRAIVPVVSEALLRAQCQWSNLDAIAVTEGPGLVGSLLVGVTYAKALCYALRLPLIAVNHVEGHIHAVVMECYPVPLPAVALVVSGGHTHLFEVRQGFQYRLLGRTRDDAAGEAYDKVAKLLGYGSPGGPILDALALHGDPRAVRFTLARMKGNDLDFSFSGLKTAVLRWVETREMETEIARRRALTQPALPRPTLQAWLEATPQPTLNLIASFQQTVIDELLRRTARAVEDTGAESVIVSGGVACNAGLRAAAPHSLPAPVYFPTPSLSTDNAAMIAAAAFPKLEKKLFAGFDLRAKANLSLT